MYVCTYIHILHTHIYIYMYIDMHIYIWFVAGLRRDGILGRQRSDVYVPQKPAKVDYHHKDTHAAELRGIWGWTGLKFWACWVACRPLNPDHCKLAAWSLIAGLMLVTENLEAQTSNTIQRLGFQDFGDY